jgi:hypothetical protein
MILTTLGPVTTRPEVQSLRYDAAPWDKASLPFRGDSLARHALTGPGIHQRKAA